MDNLFSFKSSCMNNKYDNDDNEFYFDKKVIISQFKLNLKIKTIQYIFMNPSKY